MTKSIEDIVSYSIGEPEVHIQEQEYMWSLRDEWWRTIREKRTFQRLQGVVRSL